MATAEASTAVQAKRLRQFLDFNIPVNVLIAGTMLAIWWFTNFWAALVIACLVACYVAALLFSRARLVRNEIELAVFCIAGGAVVLDLSGEYLSGGSVLPTLALLTLWPVMLALPYLRKRSLVVLMAISTATAAALTVLSLQGDSIGAAKAVPHWVPMVVNGFCMPVFVGFICLVVWHYSSQLQDTVAQLRFANASLQESERVLEERIAERTLQLAKQNEELMKLDEMKTRFVSNASHELRSPLTSIRAFSELLADDPGLNETQLEFAQAINHESERLTRLADELLSLSRIESGAVRWNIGPLDLDGELRKVGEAQAIVAERQGLAFDVDLPERLPPVLADADGLQQVLLNLTNNALKFTKVGRIVLAARLETDAVCISVSDTGPGVSHEDQQHIFERFYQAGNILTEKPAGAGLGLAICREILAQHGAQLRLTSTVGVGSCFSFELQVATRMNPVPETLSA